MCPRRQDLTPIYEHKSFFLPEVKKKLISGSRYLREKPFVGQPYHKNNLSSSSSSSKSKRQFFSSNLNLHTMSELYLADSRSQKKLGKLVITTYSTYALILVFTNPRKIVVKCVSSLKMLLLRKK